MKPIILPTQDGLLFKKPQHILYCQAASNYAHVFFTNNTSLLISKPLAYLVQQVDIQQFFRAHHSYLVNLNEVSAYNRVNGGSLQLSNGKSIPLSRTAKKAFLKQYNHDT